MQNVLISGAGIAGPALAHLLAQNGLRVTVVERATAVRSGGQAVDVRGAALTVVERMGLLPEVRALRTTMRGMTVLDGDGNELMRTEESTFSSGRLDSPDVELLREDFAELLHRHCGPDVEYLFGDRITALTQDQDGVDVEFEHAPGRRFDLVVGADGLHSAVRAHAFGPEEAYLHGLGTHLAIFGAANFLGLDDWQVWLREGDAGYGIYPVRGNSELRITAGFASPAAADLPHHRDPAAQRQLVAERLAPLRWETPKLVEAMHAAPDFYFDVMAQVRMDRWSAGRVVLLGDAGYCPSPLSGQGTSLALVGGYVLAQELARTPGDHAGAFDRYERRMRPFVEVNQALATENPGGPASEESVERAKHAIDLDAVLPGE